MKDRDSKLLALCWMAYFGAYLGRYSYSSNISEIITRYGVSHAEAGSPATLFFFAYGAAMVMFGLICSKYNKKLAVSLSLLISAAMNFAVYLEPPFGMIKYFWLVNGLAQSLLWPTLIAVLAEKMNAKALEKSVVAMSATVVAGTFFAYGCSALFAIWHAYQYSFLVGAVGMSAISVLWFVSYDRYDAIPAEEAIPKEKMGGKLKGFKNVLPTVAVLGIFAVINNLTRDGLQSWMPSVLREKYGLSGSLSILLTLLLPVLGFGGTYAVVRFSRKYKSFISLTGMLFAVASVFLALVVFAMRLSYWLPVFIAFNFTNLLMHGANNVITNMVPLYFRDKADSGMLAGALNGCSTLGSMIAAYALGAVADGWGWNAVFVLILVLCTIPSFIAGILHLRKNKREIAKA